MKKFIYFSLFVFTLSVLSACSSSSESPGEAAKKYAGYIESGKFDKFIDGIAFDEELSADQIKEQKAMVSALLEEKGKKSIEEKGGIQSTEIVSEVISEDGKSAKVILKQTFGNGKSEDSSYDMVKQDGIWKITIKK